MAVALSHGCNRPLLASADSSRPWQGKAFQMQREFNGPTTRSRQSSLLPLTAAADPVLRRLAGPGAVGHLRRRELRQQGAGGGGPAARRCQGQAGRDIGRLRLRHGRWCPEAGIGAGERFTGTLAMLPDRGWNTQGTRDPHIRLQSYTIQRRPGAKNGAPWAKTEKPASSSTITSRFCCATRT